jgi:hypothetical protein
MTRDIEWSPATAETHDGTKTDGGRSTLIHRTDRQSSKPDRTTVFPVDATGVTKMSTWLTVNTGCVVDLECFR